MSMEDLRHFKFVQEQEPTMLKASCRFLVLLALLGLIIGRVNNRPIGRRPRSTSSESDPTEIKVLKDERQFPDKLGYYKYDVELSDGTHLQQEGSPQGSGMVENETFLVIKGSYSYTSPDGTFVMVTYTADKGKFWL